MLADGDMSDCQQTLAHIERQHLHPIAQASDTGYEYELRPTFAPPDNPHWRAVPFTLQ